MPYPAAAIANEMLRLAGKFGELTPMKMQKLVYFAHGWNLALTEDPLIHERIEAGEYGPVIKALDKHFLAYGSQPITKPITEPDWEAMNFAVRVPSIDDGLDQESNAFAKALVAKVWKTYGCFEAFELSAMIHVAGSPWSEARSRGQQFIPDEEIRDYFKSLQGLPSERTASLSR